MKKMDLAETLYCIVMWTAVVFFGFAAGVWAGEHKAPQEQAAPVTVVEVRETVVETGADNPSVSCADSSLCTREPFVGADPMIEDTYLMPGHPLALELQVKLYGACLEMGVDYELALAVVEQETRFRNLMGDDGESAGYMQVQEKWHKDRMALLGVEDLRDPEGNFRVGCHFLRECIDKYGLEKGLGYYNSGKAAVTDYSREVLGRMQG